MTKTTILAAATVLLLASFAGQASAAGAVGTAASRLADADCNVPSYRNSWQDDEVQGAVKLAVLVDAEGNVQESKVISSSGHVSLDKASQRASATCKFKAAAKDSSAAPVWAQVQYNWVLN
ncbi:TonB family protein [Duganella aceris]|uniref:TonB family protein n=1 Tax=Duganella aceris TaxID=2703883 RepID=A0ABX0FRV0_9BURK|nr:TonB family protein [Duganella aceris]NGZ87378.1 TonB family protein [Duganella aceris]